MSGSKARRHVVAGPPHDAVAGRQRRLPGELRLDLESSTTGMVELPRDASPHAGCATWPATTRSIATVRLRLMVRIALASAHKGLGTMVSAWVRRRRVERGRRPRGVFIMHQMLWRVSVRGWYGSNK